MSESTMDQCIEIAEYWYLQTSEANRTEYAQQAYLDELLSWAPKMIDQEYADMKGEL
jgi:hypothetical protein